MKNLFFILLSIVLVGCSATHEFAKRKYRPGHYHDHFLTAGSISNRSVPVIQKVPANENKAEKNTLEHASNKPETNPEEDTLSGSSHIARKAENCISGSFHGSNGTIQNKKDPFAFSDPELERAADRALLYGRLSLITLFLFWLASLPLAIVAVVNANTVLNHPKSTPEQKTKARKGKTMGNIVIALFLIPLIVILLLIYWGVIKFP